MIYKFIDDQGTFRIDNPQKYNLYFPLTNSSGSLLSSISSNLAGDIKKDNSHFLTQPATIEDLRSNFLVRRDFFLKINGSVARLSLPRKNDVLEAGFLYHKVIKKIGSLNIEILSFIPHNLAVEVMWVKVKNTSGSAVKILPTSFIPLYGRAESNLRDHRHVTSLLNRLTLDKYGIILKPAMSFDESGHKPNSTNYFAFGFEGKGNAPAGQFPTLDYFYGTGTVLDPQAMEGEVLPVTKNSRVFDGKEACAAFRFKEKALKSKEEADYFVVLGISDDARKSKGLFTKINSREKVEEYFAETKKYWLNYSKNLTLDFGDKDFNGWLSWVQLQPTLRKLFGCSFLPHFDYGKGGRGWRDLWQDTLTLLLTEPQRAKGFILSNFRGVRIDGSNATIITKDGEFLSDRNRINRVWMDHGVWPYLTLKLYINKTGDVDILQEDTVYFQDHLFKRAKEVESGSFSRDYLLRDKHNKIYSGSILEHLLAQSLVQFFNVGAHNIIRLESADWNDGLDMAPELGESVAFSFMYAHNLKDLCSGLRKLKEKTEYVYLLKELLILLNASNYDDYKVKQGRLNAYLESVKNISGEKVKVKIEDLIKDLEEKSEHLSGWLRKHEWLGDGFFNGYYDNKGERVEGKVGNKIRMILTSQVFALMSGVAEVNQIKKTWQMIQKHLKDKELGGFRLNTNFGDALYLDLGRAFGFSYGDKENGAFFSHMVVMLANALYRRGFVKEGQEVLNSIYRMANSALAGIGPMIPEYFNGQGKGLYHYLTGSASWYIYTVVEEVLGIKFIFGDILLEPKLLPSNFFGPEIKLKFSLNSEKDVQVVYKITSEVAEGTSRRCETVSEVFCNKNKIPPTCEGYLILKELLNKKENLVEVLLY